MPKGRAKMTKEEALASTKARLEANTIKDGKCWIWKGKINELSGYGKVACCGRQEYAHRASYMVYVGDIPEGSWVLHKCDNKLCVKPKHLFLGSPSENTQDMIAKKRFKKPYEKGKPYGKKAKVTTQQVIDIREKYRSGEYTCAQLATEYGVRKALIGRITRRDTFDFSLKYLRNMLKVREDYAKGGYTYKDLAEKYNIDKQLVGKIVRGQSFT